MKKKIVALVAVVALVAGIAVLPSAIGAHDDGAVAKEEAVVQTAAVKEEVAAQDITEQAEEEETAAPAVTEETVKETVPSTTAAEETATVHSTTAVAKETTTAKAKKTYGRKVTEAAETVATTVVEKLGKKTSSDSIDSNSADAIGLGKTSSDCIDIKFKTGAYVVDKKSKPSKLGTLGENGGTCLQSWTASSGNTNIYVEKVQIDLDGRNPNEPKTGKPDLRNAYIAVVKTTPANVTMISADGIVPGFSEVPTITIAQRTGALFAVNNEMCIHNAYLDKVFLNGSTDTNDATVIKNGELAQEGVSTPYSLTWNTDGTWDYPVDVSMKNYSTLINNGVTNTVCYTYPVIWHGEKYKLPDTGKISDIWNDYAKWQEGLPMNRFDHTLIAKIDKDTYVFGVTEGFGQTYLWDIFLNDMGVQDGFWCNGGHCSVMYLKGCGSINGGSNGSQRRYNDPTPCITADIVAVF